MIVKNSKARYFIGRITSANAAGGYTIVPLTAEGGSVAVGSTERIEVAEVFVSSVAAAKYTFVVGGNTFAGYSAVNGGLSKTLGTSLYGRRGSSVLTITTDVAAAVEGFLIGFITQ